MRVTSTSHSLYRSNNDHSRSDNDTATGGSENGISGHHVQPITVIGLHDFADPTPSGQNPSSCLYRDQELNYQYDETIESNKVKHIRPNILPRPSSIGRRLSYINDEPLVSTPRKSVSVSWSDLPHKAQLTVLTMARLSEPLTQTSLTAYMYYQLKSFDQSLPASTIASQAGILQGGFTAAQFATAILWGRVADADWGGRKKVLLIGLFGTCISCVGFGFSRSFLQAAFFRVLGGMLNGNVGVMRTMISEIIKEKK